MGNKRLDVLPPDGWEGGLPFREHTETVVEDQLVGSQTALELEQLTQLPPSCYCEKSQKCCIFPGLSTITEVSPPDFANVAPLAFLSALALNVNDKVVIRLRQMQKCLCVCVFLWRIGIYDGKGMHLQATSDAITPPASRLCLTGLFAICWLMCKH